MTTVTAYNRARRNWRHRRRDRGQSWSCVTLNHALCSGWVGRLKPGAGPRPSCTCACHQQSDEDEV